MDTHDKNCHCLKCQQVRTLEAIEKPSVNLIMTKYGLIAQLPMWAPVSMNVIAKDLIDRLGGERGLFYTARFEWGQIDEVEEFFRGIGHQVNRTDEREGRSA